MDQLEKEMFDIVNHHHDMVTGTLRQRRQIARKMRAAARAKKWRKLLGEVVAFMLAVLLTSGFTAIFLYMLFVLKGC